MKPSFYLKLIWVLILAVWVAQAEAGTGALPSEWYQVPESQGQFSISNEGDLPEVESSVAELLKVQGEALNDLTGDEPTRAAWQVTGSAFDFAVSMNGIVGGLFGDGVSAATAFWKRRGAPDSSEDQSQGFTVIAIEDSMSPYDLERALAPALRVVRATVTEAKPGMIKKHLMSTASNFLSIARQLRMTPEGRWRVSQYVLDFGIDAGGKITGIKAGVEVRLRLVWNRGHGVRPGVDQPGDSLKNLARFVREISRELDQVSLDPVLRQGFTLSRFGVGIGITTGGEVVVVKGIARTVGRIYFTPDGKKNWSLSAEAPDDQPFTMAVTSQDSAVAFMEREEDPCKKTGGIFDPPGNPYDDFACKINRKKFRDGMVKGVKMATLFAKGSPKNPNSKWDLYRIRTNFELSVSGQWYMPWLKGLSTLDMEFVRVTKPAGGGLGQVQAGEVNTKSVEALPTRDFPTNPPISAPTNSQGLLDFLSHSLKIQNQALLEPSERAVPEYPDYDEWRYNQFQFKVKGTAGINLHWLLKTEFMPEIETVWQLR